MKIHYDQKEDAMYIRLSDAPYAESEEIQEGIIFDKDEAGDIAGIELLNVSTRVPKLNSQEFKYEVSGEE